MKTVSENEIHYEKWMSKCIKLAREAASRGGYPIGACVATPEEGIIVEMPSYLLGDSNPTNHPEISAIQHTCALVGMRSLLGIGAVLVSTLEPCVMCTGAALWAHIDTIVYGSSQTSAIEWSQANFNPKEVGSTLDGAYPRPLHPYSWRQIPLRCRDVANVGSISGNVRYGGPKVVEGLMEKECDQLFDFSGSPDILDENHGE